MLRIIRNLLFIVLGLVSSNVFKLNTTNMIIMLVLAICTVCFYDGITTKDK